MSKSAVEEVKAAVIQKWKPWAFQVLAETHAERLDAAEKELDRLRAENAALQERAERAEAALQGGVVVPLATLKWLYGEVPHPRTGLWLERPLSGGAYWWRSVLRKDIALATAKEGKS